MTFFKSFLLGIVQGVAEFLPVSSSGHLVIFQKILNLSDHNLIEFDIFLHFATLLAVLIFFKNDILEIIKGLFGKSTAGRKIFLAILIGSIPTAIIGFLFKNFFEENFSQPRTVSAMFILTGLIRFVNAEIDLVFALC